MDDIDDVVRIFDQSQWACLPIQVNFVNVFQPNLPKSELDTVKLEKQINKYNNEIAGWTQLQIFFMDRKKPDLRPLSLQLSTTITKTMEDYLFVNQLLAKDAEPTSPQVQTGFTSQRDLVQFAQ